jgi:hypothetical protein
MQLPSRIQEVQISDAPAQLMRRQAQIMNERGQQIQERALQNSYLNSQITMGREVRRIEEENKNDPEMLKKSLDNWSGKFLQNVYDPEIKGRLQLQLEEQGQGALSRATSRRDRIITEQGQFQTLTAMDEMRKEASSISFDAFSADPVVRMSAGRRMQEITSRAQHILNQTGPDGTPFLSPDARVSYLSEIKDTVLEQAAYSKFNALGSTQEQIAALDTFKAGGFMVELPNEDGSVVRVDVHGAMSQNSRNMVESTVRRNAARQEAEVQDAAQQRQIDIDLRVEQTEDPAQLAELQKQIEIMRHVLSPSGYKSSMMGILKKLDVQEKEFQAVAAGSQFASGQAYLNPQDSKSVEHYNKYYDASVAPRIAEMDQNGRNTYLTNLITNTGVIPKRLQGDIQAASKSLDVKQVAGAADLIDRIRNVNPNMINEFNERDVARLEYVRSLTEAGYNPQEAVKRADEALDPKNKQLLEDRKSTLKGTFGIGKPDYQGMAVDNFQSNWFWRHLPFTDDGVERDTTAPSGRQLIQLESDYRKAYDSHYILTGDADMAQKHANSVVSGTYGPTKINGGSGQVMKYAPENYYAIPNVKNDWMREQMIEAAKEVSVNGMFNPSFNVEEDVLLVPDPYVTPRTAKMGRPAYKLMWVNKEDGTLRDLLKSNEYFTFDPAKKKAQLIDEARADADN